ncbi:probable ubiquitin-conjugating enzyme E2 24 [Rutidosis leptorrhynchoides]|uniref:probable ubiquitin-conjugating enzyme E2 24 n=1 Tax=Rutidosis leptorrhynchoides TaxID=125765 RepID=UPI003A9A1569
MDVFFSDFDSYSESGSSSSDELDDNEFMYGGHASCILSNLEESIGKIDGFLTFERGYIYGDVVCYIDDPSGQTGKVINVEKVVDLENVYGTKLKNINSKKLKMVRSISIGDYVVSGHWLGKVERIVDRVTVLLDDGTKCEFSEMDQEKLVPLSSDSFHDSQFTYFPGQRVKVKHSFSLKSTIWFCGTEYQKEHEGTVCTINAGFVFVKWLGCVPFASEKAVPESFQNSESLTVLSGLTHSNWQLGDWCLLPKFQELFVISKTNSKVDVLWQDGSESFGLDSGSLNPVNIVDAHDFWPHQFVLEKGTCDDQGSKKYGVVKIVSASEKTVNVKWEGNGIEETVSAYELIEHPEFSFSHGDVVFGLGPGLDKLCPFGTVIGLEDGNVEVKWAAGFTSKVSPNAVFPMDKCEFVAGTQLPHNENIEPNQEKSEHDVPATDPKLKDLQDTDGNKIFSFIPGAAFGCLSNFAARFFGSLPYTSLDSISEEQGSSFDTQEENVVSVEAYIENVTFSSSSKIQEKVDNFEIISDCSMHHFVDHAGKASISNQVKRNWLKKVQQEWSILMKDLPETIYVRVFEERMDLLQVGIVGAPGTPYHDGLFFFDIFLPPEYPQEPPMVHYVSGGLRVNPNLYESGRVCLSLLNTWTGTGSETWNPNGSTILQVLLSLQALVLNKDPYFNEAGYDQQVGSVEGEKNSCSYSENVFLVSCKSMIYTLRNPPKHFGGLVDEHFRQRYTNILTACKAYMEGVPIGYAFEGEHTEDMGQTKSSTGFKITLSKIYIKLVEAFTAKGLECGEYTKM